MKNFKLKIILLFCIIISISSTTFSTPKLYSYDSTQIFLAHKIKVHINLTLTSAQGCKFKIVGDASTSGLFGGDISFTGTLEALGGGSGCPTGTWTFGMTIYDNGSTSYKGSDGFKRYMDEHPELVRQIAAEIAQEVQ